MTDEFHTDGYQRLNQARQAHLASLGLDLDLKCVLELVAGVGDHTGFWLERGCKVACVEARKENWQKLRALHPDVLIRDFDLERKMFLPIRQIVYAYGILYHLRNAEDAIGQWAGACTELLLLETCVDPHPLPKLTLVKESADSQTGSFSGTGCRPTRLWVYRELQRHFSHVYLPLTQPDHEEFPLDWSEMPYGEDDPGEAVRGLIRAVFIASRSSLQNPLLVEQLPTRYLRCTQRPKSPYEQKRHEHDHV